MLYYPKASQYLSVFCRLVLLVTHIIALFFKEMFIVELLLLIFTY